MTVPGRRSDGADVVVVIAKEPRPGRVKTRLQAGFTADEAASLAAAALADTLTVVRVSRARRRVLAWDGDPTGWRDGFELVAQPPGDLGARLAAAFGAAAGDDPERSVLLVGMDTPQLTAELLDRSWHGADAVLGLSEDGGFWAIGLRGIGSRGSVDPRAVFDGIPMSTTRTGAAQLARLAALGLTVELLPPLRDIDEPADAEYVADRHPELRFSRRYAELMAGRCRQPVDRLFDELYAGGPVSSSAAGASPAGFEAGLPRWVAAADSVDAMVVSRCVPPVIDLGCGPGRIVGALQRSGRAVLGVDISRAAVALATRDGGQILRRDVAAELPGEGRWGTALLLDGNIGIGGDVAALLDRCRRLVGPGGLIICELDPDPERADRAELVLAGSANRSAELPWSRIGLRRVQSVAVGLDLIMVEEWRAGGRAFVSLRTVG